MTDARDMERLEELARAASEGPWEWGGDTLFGRKGVKIIDHASYEGMWFSTYDAGFDAANKALIAAANPATILSLISDLTNARAALKEAEGGWQDIEDHDGSECHVLIAEADGSVLEARLLDDGRGWWARGNDPTDHWGEECCPTHWRPLPTPPARSKEPK